MGIVNDGKSRGGDVHFSERHIRGIQERMADESDQRAAPRRSGGWCDAGDNGRWIDDQEGVFLAGSVPLGVRHSQENGVNLFRIGGGP